MGTNSVHCKNCSNQFQGKFCNICGQKADTYRINWMEVFHHLPNALFHLDEGFFYTIKQLAIRPGHAIREYLEGKRKPHYNPFFMLVMLAGICSYLFVYFHFQTILASVRLDKLEFQKPFIAHKYFFGRTIFFCGLCSVGDYVLFYKKKYSLPEMVVSNVFMFCQVTVFQLLFIPFLLVGRYFDINFYFRILFIIIVMAYLFISRYQLYLAKANNRLIVKIVFALLLYLAISMVVGLQLVKPVFEN